MPTKEQYEAVRDWCMWQNDPQPYPYGWLDMVKDMKTYQRYDEYLGAMLDQVLVDVFGLDFDIVHDWTFDETIGWANTEIARCENA